MTAEQMWHAYCESSGVSEQTPYSAWAFCGGGAVDRSLAYWKAVHREAFTPDFEAAGKPFDEHGLCVLEEFALLYPAITK